MDLHFQLQLERQLEDNTLLAARDNEGGDGGGEEEQELVERTWEGLLRYELRLMLREGAWPEDPDFAEASEEVLNELTPEVNSYDSAVHRRLHEQRALYYDRFRKEFVSEVRRRDSKLADRMDTETAWQRRWQKNVQQIKGEFGGETNSSSTERAPSHG